MLVPMLGQTIAHYTITEKIGQGGMGEVYRATDTKLKRDVALKVLPESLSKDPQRMARFTREAQVLASLNHPNIGAIHGLEEEGEVRALVLELIEGEDLSERIARGPIPSEEALRIALQIAEALEAAHRKGIIHRDLKPANVKITPEGTAKVLDFGLAKAMEEEPQDLPELTASPTLSVAMTKAGFILGTAAYMSPEQARGQAVDQRTDIWVFGVVLFEMLTARSAFAGPSTTDLLAAVIKEEPEWAFLPAMTPPAVSRVLRRCITKDPRTRLQHIGDARLDLEEALTGTALELPVEAAPKPLADHFRWLSAAAAGVLLGALGMWMFELPAPTEVPPVMRFTIPVANADASLSPDGQQLAFISETDLSLHIRQLRSNTNRKLDTRFTVRDMAWSPDSRLLAISGQGKLATVRLDDGQLQPLCDLPPPTRDRRTYGISWNDQGTVIFATGEGILYRVSSGGGSPEPLTTLDQSRGEIAHTWPQFLPDQDHFIYLVQSRQSENSGIHVGSLSASEPRMLLKTDVRASFMPPNYLMFVDNNTLQARHLNVERMFLEEEGFTIAAGIGTFPAYGIARFSSSNTGVLIYQTLLLSEPAELSWFDRSGNQLGTVGAPVPGPVINLSPDESHLAMTRFEDAEMNIWITNFARDTSVPMGNEPGGSFDPQWSPDGSRIAFTSNRRGGADLFVKSLSEGPAELLQASDVQIFMCDWSADGRHIIYHEGSVKFLGLPLFGDREPFVVLDTPYTKDQAQFSPNARWIAYNADNTGRHEVYVTSFPRGGEEIPVSKDGGMQPRWSHDGRELFFLDPESRLMVVDVEEVGEDLEFGTPQVLFSTRLRAIPNVEKYDVTRDGKRFIMAVPVESSDAQLHVVVNWPSLMER